jgi:hypothetical protein
MNLEVRWLVCTPHLPQSALAAGFFSPDPGGYGLHGSDHKNGADHAGISRR